MRRRDVLLATTLFALSRTARAVSGTTPGAIPLARFITTYETDAAHRPRAFNVELAAEAVDGSALVPGATFSFNDTVGERTAAYGYEKSVVLRRHMLAEGMGGGTCQVASTLYAAALLAGLDVIDRTPHSRPSAYIRVGLDATVAFSVVDLKLRNARTDRVVLRAHAARGTLNVWVEADGSSRPHVSVTSEIALRIPYPREILREASVPEDEVRVRSYGIPGYRVVRTRDVDGEDHARRDRRTDVYAPVSEVLVTSPSFDMRRLDLLEPEDTPEGRVSPALFRDEEGAQKPALVQLRPTTLVVLDNAP
jgi:hypothetical protein